MSSKTILVVLGMHRSGTSAAAGALSAIGLGYGGSLLAPKSDNPVGFWENRRIVELNDRMLEAFNLSWDSPERFFDSELVHAMTVRFKMDISRLLREEFSDEIDSYIKDPRMCRLIPVWHPLMVESGLSPVYLHIVRHPLEVAKSLEKRNAIPVSSSILLWLLHNYSAESFTREYKRAFIRYSDLVAEPDVTISTALRALGYPDSLCSSAHAASKSVNSSHCHHIASGNVPPEYGIYSDMANRFYGAITIADRALRNADQVAFIDNAVGVLKTLESRLLPWRDFYKYSEKAHINSAAAEIERTLVSGLVSNLDRYFRKLGACGDLAKSNFSFRGVASAHVTNFLHDYHMYKRGYESIVNSRSWKLMAPARRFNSGLAHLRALIWRRARSAAKLVYHALPVPMKFKAKLRTLFYALNTSQGFNADFIADLRMWIDSVRHTDIDLTDTLTSEHGTPKASIVIPVYNKIEYTLDCLKSIALDDSDESYEIIVVDDCSSDGTSETLSNLKGLVYLRNEINEGFIVSCNRGADVATGEFVVFLNNDTIVMPGWLEALLETFSTKPDAGLVGARLIYPDGKLQEAGGIVWDDASAWNYGNGDDPLRPEYSYLRKVDYCSGACIGIRRNLLLQLGGFDELYKPAYYEDTDLAFRVADSGRSVYYQPACRVIHFEGVTSGTDLAAGVKQYQVVNREKFHERWQRQLLKHKPNGVDVDRQRDRGVKSNILVIDACTPTPDRDSGSLRMFTILKLMCELGYKVTFVPSNLSYDGDYTIELQSIGVEVLYRPYVKSIPGYLSDNATLFDVAFITRVDVADAYLDEFRKHNPAARVIFDTVDLHFLREQRQAEIESNPILLRRSMHHKALELGLASRADITSVVSPVEREVLIAENMDPQKVVVLSNIHSVQGRSKEFEERRGMLFIGGFNHLPNADAVLYFVDQIWGRVHDALPDARFYVIGSDAPPEIRGLDVDGVEVIGFVENIRPYFDDIRLSVVPLRYGAGVKGKVNTSMSYGVPVVSTSIGVEGMMLVNGKEVLVADDPQGFSDNIIRLYNDSELWYQLSNAGMENIRKVFSEDRARSVLNAICDTQSVVK